MAVSHFEFQLGLGMSRPEDLMASGLPLRRSRKTNGPVEKVRIVFCLSVG
jgi:hypothetical protein